jgi:hypothetical protein
MMLTPYNQAAAYNSGLPPHSLFYTIFFDITVEVRDVFMIIQEKEEIFELVTVPLNVIGDLVVSEFMCLSVIVVYLIQKTAEEAVPIRVHAVDVGSVREERPPELLNARAALGRGLAIRYHRIRQVGRDAALLQGVEQTPSLLLCLADKLL